VNFHQVFQKKFKKWKNEKFYIHQKKSNSESGLLRNPMILPFETKKRRRKKLRRKKLLPTYLIIKKYVFVCHMPKLKQKKTHDTKQKL